MRVLLAGATGAIGRPLIRALTGAGHDVVALIRNPGNRELVRSLGGESVVADVMRREELLRADDPTNALRRDGTAHLLEAARAVGARRFVTQSMILGYGYTDHGDRELTEDDPFGEPRGSYADSTVAALESGRPGHAYNIVDGAPVSWQTFASTVAAAHGTPRPRAMPRWPTACPAELRSSRVPWRAARPGSGCRRPGGPSGRPHGRGTCAARCSPHGPRSRPCRTARATGAPAARWP